MSAEAVEVEVAVAALYRRTLGQFVAARDQLARQLRATGDRDAAREEAASAADQAHAAAQAVLEELEEPDPPSRPR